MAKECEDCRRLLRALAPFAAWAKDLPQNSGEVIYAYHGVRRLSEFRKRDIMHAARVVDRVTRRLRRAARR